VASSVKSVRLDDGLWEWAEDYARQRSVTRNAVVSMAVEALRGDAAGGVPDEPRPTAGRSLPRMPRPRPPLSAEEQAAAEAYVLPKWAPR
jgi:hypothetical protein